MKFIFTLLLLGSTLLLHSQNKYQIEEAKLSISFPSSWRSPEISKVQKNEVNYNFKHFLSNQTSISNVIIDIKKIPKRVDVVEYSLVKSSRFPFVVNHETSIDMNTFPLVLENTIAYKAEFSKDGVEYNMYLLHIKNKNRGIEIIAYYPSANDLMDVEIKSIIQSIVLN